MKFVLPIFLLFCLLGFLAKPVDAHQPRMVTGEQTVTIENPAVSQAFYGTLRGEPAEFQITTENELDLYVSILVPDLPERRKDFTVEVFRIDDGERTLLSQLDGANHDWETFHEPFVNDTYFQGPESENTLPAGIYTITVSNPDNTGKYVLSVGQEESFSLAETIQTIQRLPDVKRFFNKSPWTAYFNLVGVFIVVSLLILVALVYGVYRLGSLLFKK